MDQSDPAKIDAPGNIPVINFSVKFSKCGSECRLRNLLETGDSHLFILVKKPDFYSTFVTGTRDFRSTFNKRLFIRAIQSQKSLRYQYQQSSFKSSSYEIVLKSV